MNVFFIMFDCRGPQSFNYKRLEQSHRRDM